MTISQITAGGRYIKSAADTGAEKKTDSVATQNETAADRGRTDAFIRTEASGKTEAADYRPLKKLSGSQVRTLKDQRAESMRRLVTEMLGKQAAKAKTAAKSEFEQLSGTADKRNSWMSQFLGPQDTPETAAQAISKDGEWGVNAVATRLLDMAVALSGGDTSKISALRGAVEAGFKAAGDVLGGALPGVCQETYTETMKRFDYWEQNGSLNGYVMQA